MGKAPSRRHFLAGGASLGLVAACKTGAPVRRRPGQAHIPYTDEQLMGGDGHRVLYGSQLAEVAFPIGGIGTGSLSITGAGDLDHFELWNRPARGLALPFTFVSIRAQREGEAPVLRVARAEPPPPHGEGEAQRLRGGGFPHLASARFDGAYPMCRVDFDDPVLPVRLQLEAWNPMVPLSVEDSSLPVAILTYTLRNPSHKSVDVRLAFSTINPIGHDWRTSVHAIHDAFGGNIMEAVNQKLSGGRKLFGLASGSERVRADFNNGSYAIAAICDEAETATYDPRTFSECTNQVYHYGDHLLRTGQLLPGAAEMPTPDGRTCWGALAPRVVVPPKQERAVTFLVGWHVPNRENYWHAYPEIEGAVLRNDYGKRFADAWSVVEHVARELPRLERQTRQFRDALCGSTVPGPILDAVSSQMAIVRTSTCMLLDDEINGRTLYGFEGADAGAGSFPLNCTHVWNYAQSVAYLFPSLERSMRRVDFLWNMFDDGSMAFRTIVPLGRRLWDWYASADGQLGTVVRLYREWQLSGDEEFLREMWPGARKALEYAWVSWDADRDGVIEGEQHNTYDVEFYGPNTMIGTLYLAALRAMGEMAQALGEADLATRYRALAERGRHGYEGLWNGEYFVQHVPAASAITAPPTSGANENDPPLRALVEGDVRHQVGTGCLSDQLVGQWLARQLGLGDLLDPAKVRIALGAIFAHNFRVGLYEHVSSDRVFARHEERALLNCTWPRGGRPAWPVLYADEAWTGVEYQVAAHLIHEGLVREGLSIVKAVRDRHDGQRRNPWDDREAGHNYARAMSSFSLLLAAAGFSCSAPEKRLGFAPRFFPHDFQCLFSSGTAWGVYTQSAEPERLTAAITVHGGQQDLLILDLPALVRGPGKGRVQVTVRYGNGTIETVLAEVQADATRTRLAFKRVCRIEAGGSLTVVVG